ncbi:calcium/proton exchanger [Cryptococcus amylolentus CBS 6273]|uniref:Calcium/proton exchanger n=1 Tax=Cryptococcus amylolentus CBS 6273 TaxID=1296118 RepID=A0A1E3KFL9_9TREE|nr:calcium/proton exchanger [Cryptococcus amylolentus CBS 6273]
MSTPSSDNTEYLSASSPTPTIRNNATPARPPTSSQAFASAVGVSPGHTPGGTPSQHTEQRRTHSGQQQQQELGKGRPSRNELPPPAASPSTGRPALSPARASYSSADDEDYLGPNSYPHTAGPGNTSFESTPRGWSSARGRPQTALGSSFGSPTTLFNPAARDNNPPGGSNRLGRGSRFNSAREVSQNTGGGTGSRSASRARPPLFHHHSSSRDRAEIQNGEEEDVDRGAELIKQRQKERRAKKKRQQQEVEGRRLAEEGTTPETSNPPTGVPGQGFKAQQGTSHRAPSSRVREVSSTRRLAGDSDYFPYPGSVSGTETPRDGRLSPRDDLRPASIYSSVADEDEDELDERASLVGDIVNDVIGEETGDRECNSDEDDEEEIETDEGVTLRDRQDAINIEHPFGLPIWKPALYRKSRSVTRNAESALHSIPSAAAERHLLPGNIIWTVVFGWWLTLICLFVALLVSGAEVAGGGRGGYGKTLRGLAWYIGWPFGKYVEGEGGPVDDEHTEGDGDNEDAEQGNGQYGAVNGSGSPVSKRAQRREVSGASSGITVKDTQRPDLDGTSSPDAPSTSTVRAEPAVSFAPNVKGKGKDNGERTALLGGGSFRRPRNKKAKRLGMLVYWPTFLLVIVPVMLFVCVLCWCFVVTIPMAKLTWKLLNLLYTRPLEINFRAAPKVPVPTPHPSSDNVTEESDPLADESPAFTLRRARLHAGQVAPTSGPTSTVLLCTYRAVGLQYYKYTVGGVNILFINLLPLVFFTIIDGMLLLPFVEHQEHIGKPITPLLRFLTSQALIFVLALASVIPLSYFIGMAVASISAQSSIGMGAVINATFGSIIEIILYAIALMQGKGRLVEGSIIGSILAGVLLMPGASMCSGALKKKEQKFNAKSAGVTSTMLIMAIIGTLTPTMFYQTYGSFELHCEGCPAPTNSTTGHTTLMKPEDVWMCNHCYYEHPDPELDPFYQENVKTLMYGCAAILLFSYLIGLWFSLRTHATQIWQNPQQLLKPEEHQALGVHPAVKATLTQRLTPQAFAQHLLPLHQQQKPPHTASPVIPVSNTDGQPIPATASPKGGTLRLDPSGFPKDDDGQPSAGPYTVPGTAKSVPNNHPAFTLPAGYTPYLEGLDQAAKQNNLTPMRLPGTLTTEDFTRAVAVATVSALRHQGSIVGSERKHRHGEGGGVAVNEAAQGAHVGHGAGDGEEGGGHEAPSWTRGVSAGVLLGCTLLYAIIAEILVDVVDVVMQGSGIDEKFLGLTLFALVPNTTEFMNAMSFALNGNIALSMEIGSAYALQVCLLQIPAMVAFSALYKPDKMGDVIDTFTLIFPRWDVIAIILSIFLLTYTYIEARSNYHRGSILVLAYVVLIMGFYYAPVRETDDPTRDEVFTVDAVKVAGSLGMEMTKLWT